MMAARGVLVPTLRASSSTIVVACRTQYVRCAPRSQIRSPALRSLKTVASQSRVQPTLLARVFDLAASNRPSPPWCATVARVHCSCDVRSVPEPPVRRPGEFGGGDGSHIEPEDPTRGARYREPSPSQGATQGQAPPQQSKQQPEAEEETRYEYVNPKTGERGGPRGPEPTRYGDWERKGRCSDF